MMILIRTSFRESYAAPRTGRITRPKTNPRSLGNDPAAPGSEIDELQVTNAFCRTLAATVPRFANNFHGKCQQNICIRIVKHNKSSDSVSFACSI